VADNVFSSAQIRVEAETSKAEQALKDLRGQMDQLGKSLDDLAAKQKTAGDAGQEFGRVNQSLGEVKKSLKDVSDLMSVLARLQAPITIARDFYQLGNEITAVAEKLLGIPDDVGAAMSALADEDKSPIQLLRKHQFRKPRFLLSLFRRRAI
jgi:ABC-type transporter Mla subunit MlaD